MATKRKYVDLFEEQNKKIVKEKRGFICTKEDFQECLVTEKKFKSYYVPKGTRIYHGTTSNVTPEMIISRSNYFGDMSAANIYKETHQKKTNNGVTHCFVFMKPAILFRMDLCRNIKILKEIATEEGNTRLVSSIDSSFQCKDKKIKLPRRYSENVKTDTDIAKFIVQHLPFNGFAAKRQRAISDESWNRIIARKKEVSKDSFFHAELYLENPSLFLRPCKG